MSERLFAVARNAAHSSWTYRGVRLSPVSRSLAASCVVPELRPLRSPGVTRLHRYYEPLRHLHRPGLSLAGAQLEGEPSTGETSLVASDVLRCMPMPLPRRNCKVPISFSSFAAAAFPQLGDGRLPHYSYRGLLSIHSRFGLQLRQVAISDPYTRDSGGFVTSTTPPVATGWNDPCRTGLAPAKHQTPFQGVPNLPKSRLPWLRTRFPLLHGFMVLYKRLSKN